MSKMYKTNIKKEKVMLKMISHLNIYLMYIKEINKEIKKFT